MQAQISQKTKKQEMVNKKEREEKKALKKAQKMEMSVIRLHQGKYKELNRPESHNNMSTCPEVLEGTTEKTAHEEDSDLGKVSPSAFKEVKNYEH